MKLCDARVFVCNTRCCSSLSHFKATSKVTNGGLQYVDLEESSGLFSSDVRWTFLFYDLYLSPSFCISPKKVRSDIDCELFLMHLSLNRRYVPLGINSAVDEIRRSMQACLTATSITKSIPRGNHATHTNNTFLASLPPSYSSFDYIFISMSDAFSPSFILSVTQLLSLPMEREPQRRGLLYRSRLVNCHMSTFA